MPTNEPKSTGKKFDYIELASTATTFCLVYENVFTSFHNDTKNNQLKKCMKNGYNGKTIYIEACALNLEEKNSLAMAGKAIDPDTKAN